MSQSIAFLNRAINRAFRAHSLSIRGDAAKLIIQALAGDPNITKTLNSFVKLIKESGLKSTFVDRHTVEVVLASLAHNSQNDDTEVLVIISAFDTPRYAYNAVRKVFIKARKTQPLHGQADDKAMLFRDRYKLVHQRIMRNDLFTPPQGPADKSAYHQITNIDSLMGRPGRKLIFGLLTQLREGKWHIEDGQSSVQVDIRNAKVTSGLFTENCLVLAEGELLDDVFIVTTLGFPPPERRKDTIRTFGHLDCFGLEMQDKQKLVREKRSRLRKEMTEDMVIILSDVFLDKPEVLTKLRVLFEGFASEKPPLFVLMGNFTSTSPGRGDSKKLKGYFDQLADLIAEFPALIKASKFLFLAGPSDPTVAGAGGGHANIMPRPPLPSLFTRRLRDKLGKSAVFSTSPCRVLYSGLEMVLFRDDLLHKLRRNCVVPPSEHETSEVSEHLVKTVCDQAHLCPLPMEMRPVYWNYDHALSLYPLPHVLILADVAAQYDWTYEGCNCVNPGSFSTDWSFVVYWPGKQKAEFSRLPS